MNKMNQPAISLFSLLLLWLSFHCSAQHPEKLKTQRFYYELASKLNEQKELESALNYYFLAYNSSRDSELGQQARRNLDSLKQISREHLMRQIKGEWLKITTASSWRTFDYDRKDSTSTILVITGDSILFYSHGSLQQDKRSLQAEKIRFYEDDYLNPYFRMLLFPDGSAWELVILDTQFLQISSLGRVDKNHIHNKAYDGTINLYRRIIID
jgi:hypothetical protein